MKKLLSVILLMMMSISGHAYLYLTWDGVGYNYKNNQEVEFFIVGEGGSLSNNFLDSAITRARRHREIFPNRAQIILWANEAKDCRDSDGNNIPCVDENSSVLNQESAAESSFQGKRLIKDPDIEYLNGKGLWILSNKNFDKSLSWERVLYILAQNKRIASIHFFGHSSGVHGLMMQKGEEKINYLPQADLNDLDRKGVNVAINEIQVDYWNVIKNNIIDGGYIYLHGCNTGFYTAPNLSKLIGVPVFGSLTSTAFQTIFEDRQWYFRHGEEAGTGVQFPLDLDRADINSGYDEREHCRNGYCTRLKPDMYRYKGFWGDYKAGLPFYKAFCSFDLSSQRNLYKCQQALVESVLTWPTPYVAKEKLESFGESDKHFAKYLSGVYDFICSNNAHERYSDYASTCRGMLEDYKYQYLRGQKNINEFKRNYSGYFNRTLFGGSMIACDFNNCDFDIESSIIEDDGNMIPNIDFVPTKSGDVGNEPYVQEFKNYLDAYFSVY